jgi:hypothetical protein
VPWILTPDAKRVARKDSDRLLFLGMVTWRQLWWLCVVAALDVSSGAPYGSLHRLDHKVVLSWDVGHDVFTGYVLVRVTWKSSFHGEKENGIC